MIKLNKPQKKEIIAFITAVITFLAALGLIAGCTNTLIKIRGEGNKIHQEQKADTKVDSVTTKIDIKK
nr:MAG TPA: SecE/Sec61-gamma subunits of protein translocation complex [Microviridae sp.]